MIDIENEWMWLAQPRLSEQTRRTRLDLDSELPDGTVRLALRGGWAYVMTAEVVRFLNPDRDNGIEAAWNDNGDGRPQAGEQGRVLRRTGGRCHAARLGYATAFYPQKPGQRAACAAFCAAVTLLLLT